MAVKAHYPNQRVAIFVDVQNLYHSAKNLYHGRVNYRELIRHLVGDRQLIRAVAYVVKSEGVDGVLPKETPKETVARAGASEAAFFDALVEAGLELRSKDLQVYADGSKKADWDVGMAVDAIRMASSVDVIILVTGDGDFIPLVEYLKWGAGQLVEVAAFRRSASLKLQEAADEFVNLEESPRIIMRPRR